MMETRHRKNNYVVIFGYGILILLLSLIMRLNGYNQSFESFGISFKLYTSIESFLSIMGLISLFISLLSLVFSSLVP